MNNTSKISTPRTLRLRNETIEYFEGKPLNRLIDSLAEHIKDGSIEVRGEELSVRGGVDGVPGKVVKDLELIGKFEGMNFGEMFKELHRALDAGEIEIEDGRFIYPKV